MLLGLLAVYTCINGHVSFKLSTAPLSSDVGEAFRDELGVELLQDRASLKLIVFEDSDEYTVMYS
jgi:hypothetical protein